MNLENIDAEKWIKLAIDYGLNIIGAIAIYMDYWIVAD